jgi:hypothetical protein
MAAPLAQSRDKILYRFFFRPTTAKHIDICYGAFAMLGD